MDELRVRFVFLLFVTSLSSAQSTFQIAYGGSGEETCSKILANGSRYVLTGHTTSSGAGSYDILFLETDTDGNILNSNSIGSEGEDITLSAAIGNTNNYLLTGYTNSFGGDHPFVVNVDSTGSMLWAKYYSLNGWANDIIPTNDNCFLLTGYAGLTDIDIFLMKIDSSGNPLWIKSFGDSLLNEGTKVIQSQDGGIIVCGTTFLQEGGPTDVAVIRTDSAGNQLWSYRYGVSGWDLGYAMAISGSEILLGSMSYTNEFNAPNSEDILLLRLDSSGSVKKAFVAGSSDVEVIRDILVNDDGSFSITGATNHWGSGYTDLLFATFDTTGQIINQQVFGGLSYDQGLTLTKANNNTALIAGYTQSFGVGINDFYIIKTAADYQGQCNNNAISLLYSDISISKQTAFSTIPISCSFSSASFTESPSLLTFQNLCPSGGIPESKIITNLAVSPNPFSLKAVLSFTLLADDNIQLNLNDIRGRRIKEILNKKLSSGNHQVVLNRSGIASGIYFCELRTASEVSVIKIILH